MTDQTRPMDTKRIAEIRARVEAATPGPWTTKTLHTTLADAAFIAHSGEDVPYLLDLVASLTAERDEYRRALRYLVGNEWEESAGDTLSEKAMSTVIDRQASELAALRAVVEEARDEIESWKINANLEVVANEAAVLAILDRGLKGENNG